MLYPPTLPVKKKKPRTSLLGNLGLIGSGLGGLGALGYGGYKLWDYLNKNQAADTNIPAPVKNFFNEPLQVERQAAEIGQARNTNLGLPSNYQTRKILPNAEPLLDSRRQHEPNWYAQATTGRGLNTSEELESITPYLGTLGYGAAGASMLPSLGGTAWGKKNIPNFTSLSALPKFQKVQRLLPFVSDLGSSATSFNVADRFDPEGNALTPHLAAALPWVTTGANFLKNLHPATRIGLTAVDYAAPLAVNTIAKYMDSQNQQALEKNTAAGGSGDYLLGLLKQLSSKDTDPLMSARVIADYDRWSKTDTAQLQKDYPAIQGLMGKLNKRVASPEHINNPYVKVRDFIQKQQAANNES